jgi:hypothetical protein
MDDNKYAQYIEAQEAWIKMVNLQPGDKVKVLYAAESHENGWRSSWVSEMDNEVGKVLVVRDGHGHGSGITLKDSIGRSSLSYPFFVLQKVESPLPKSIKISDSYKAEFKKDGSIKVGCQDISYVLLKQIYETATSVISNK